MKTLFIVRHAKSSWDDPSQSDFDRPLNDRGKRDAPKMAKRLKDKKFEIEVFISSPAKRAKKTASYFMEEYNSKEKDLLLVDNLYEASPSAFFDAVKNIDNKYDHAALFSHNPGITAFVNSLTDQIIPEMPTCAIFGIKILTENWKDFETAKKELLLFDYPKND